MSIRLKINLVLLVIGIMTSILVAAFNYYEARNRVFTEAQKKGRTDLLFRYGFKRIHQYHITTSLCTISW